MSNMKEILYSSILKNNALSSPTCFIHTPPLVEMDYIAILLAENFSKLHRVVSLVANPDGNNIEQSMNSCREEDPTTIIVENFERILDSPTSSNRLEKVRYLSQKVEFGPSRLIMLSSKSAAHYPSTIGSSPIIDAAKIHSRPLSLDFIRNIASSGDQSDLDVIMERCGGSRRLIELSLELNSSTDSNRSRRKLFDEAMADLAEESVACLRQASRQKLGTLMLNQSVARFEFSVDELGEDFVDELVASGVANYTDRSESWILIFPFRAHQELWIQALKDKCNFDVIPPVEWERSISYMFEIERTLRANILCHWIESDTDLDERLTLERASIMNQAKENLGHSPESLANMSNPLEWITLEKLFVIAFRELELAHDGKLLSNDHSDWKILERCLIPPRNRLAHMRWPEENERVSIQMAWTKFGRGLTEWLDSRR